MLEVAPGLPQLQIDRVRMRLLLRNLLDNARRYSVGTVSGGGLRTGDGEADVAEGRGAGGPVKVSLAREGNTLVLRVRDHGPGVADAQLAHLAEPFFRADTARQRSTGGVGLGLYLCRLVAQAHGGSLSVRNAHPGLQVTVSLPISGPLAASITPA